MWSKIKYALTVFAGFAIIAGIVLAREYPIIEQYPVFHELSQQYPNMFIFVPYMSSDGRYIFYKLGFGNEQCPGSPCENIYSLDRQTGTQEQINLDKNNQPLANYNDIIATSPDGRYVLFYHSSGAAPYKQVQYLRDRQAQMSVKLKLPIDGNTDDIEAFPMDVSADGRFILFLGLSHVDELPDSCDVYGADWLCLQLYLYDRKTEFVENVAPSYDGTWLEGAVINAAMSDDARYIVFASSSPKHVVDDTNGVDDLFIYDRTSGSMKRISKDQNGSQVPDACHCRPQNWNLRITPDGHFVMFITLQGLVDIDTNNDGDVYVYDNITDTNELISIDASGTFAVGNSLSYGLSDNGRFVSFNSFNTQAVTGNPDYCDPATDGISVCDFIPFVHDRVTHETTLVSHLNPDLDYKGGGIYINAMSDNGKFLTYPALVSKNPDQWTFYVAKRAPELEPTFSPEPSKTPSLTPTITSTPDPNATPTPTNVPLELMVNGGFETEGTGDQPAAAWKGNNLNGDDKRKCNQDGKPPVSYTGNCAFRFKNTLNVNTQIRQKTYGPFIEIGETLTLSAYVAAKNLTGKVQIKAQIQFSDLTETALKLNPLIGTYDYQFLSQSLPVEMTVGNVKIILSVANGGGRFDIDDVSLEITTNSLGPRLSLNP